MTVVSTIPFRQHNQHEYDTTTAGALMWVLTKVSEQVVWFLEGHSVLIIIIITLLLMVSRAGNVGEKSIFCRQSRNPSAGFLWHRKPPCGLVMEFIHVGLLSDTLPHPYFLRHNKHHSVCCVYYLFRFDALLLLLPLALLLLFLLLSEFHVRT